MDHIPGRSLGARWVIRRYFQVSIIFTLFAAYDYSGKASSIITKTIVIVPWWECARSSFVFFYRVSFLAQHPKSYTISSAGLSDSGTVPSAMPSSNTINDVYVQNDTVWFATAEGPSYTLNGGVSWINLAGIAGFDTKGISAIAARGNLIWMAVGYTTTLNGTDYETGGGLHYSTDHGATWNFIAQPVDFGKNRHYTIRQQE